MKVNVLKNFDFLLSIFVFLMTGSVIINSIFLPNISLALFNFLVSIVPFVYILIKNRKMQIKKNNICFILFGIFFVRLLTSLLFDIFLNNQMMIQQFCFDFSAFVIILSILSIQKIDKIEYDFKYFINAIIVMSVVFCIYNVFHNISNLFYFSNIKYRYLISFSSFFENKNLFGEFLFLSLVAIELKKDFIDNGKISNKNLILKIFLILNLFLTLSRSAILAYLVFELILLILKKQYKLLFIIFFICFLFYVFNLFGIVTFLKTYVIRADNAASGREDIWKICLYYFEQKPVLGYGELYISNLIDSLSGVTSMHNWYLKILLCGGIINLVLYICLFCNLLFLSFKNVLIKSKYSYVYFSFIISLLIYGIFEEVNLFEFGFISIINTMFFCVLPIIYFRKD